MTRAKHILVGQDFAKTDSGSLPELKTTQLRTTQL
jgi:hypothetical protein